jgi:hypothetical protein
MLIKNQNDRNDRRRGKNNSRYWKFSAQVKKSTLVRIEAANHKVTNGHGN